MPHAAPLDHTGTIDLYSSVLFFSPKEFGPSRVKKVPYSFTFIGGSKSCFSNTFRWPLTDPNFVRGGEKLLE